MEKFKMPLKKYVKRFIFKKEEAQLNGVIM